LRQTRETRGADLRHTEVEHLHQRTAAEAARQKEVLRLDVAMHDPERMRLGHRFAGLRDIVGGVIERERAMLGEQRGEVAPLEELHHHEGNAGRHLADVEHLGHVLTLQPRRRPCLAKKALLQARLVQC
jgi:hypothetical protein